MLGATEASAFRGYVSCAPGGSLSHHCFEGDLPTAHLSGGKAHGTYQVCVRGGGKTRCKSRRFNGDGVGPASFGSTPGSYSTSWRVHSRTVATWSYSVAGEGV